MRLIVVLLMWTMLPRVALSQTVLIEKDSLVVGENALTGGKVVGYRYKFVDPIVSLYVDSLGDNFAAHLRKLKANEKYFGMKGQMFGYDIKKDTLLWASDLKFNKHRILFGEVIIKNSIEGGDCLCIDAISGKVLLTAESMINCYINSCSVALSYNVGIAEISGTGVWNKSPAWTKRFAAPYMWEDLVLLDESSLLVMCNGVHRLNVCTGEGWSFETPMGTDDFKSTAGKIGLAAATIGAAMMGTIVIPPSFGTKSYAIRGMNSNLVLAGDTIMFASREKLTCLKQDGVSLWQATMPEKWNTMSYLAVDDTVAYVVNYGRARTTRKDNRFGVPFIAAYNRADGAQRYIKQVDDKVVSLKFDSYDQILYLLFENRIACYNYTTGELIREKVFDITPAFADFVRADIFLPSADLVTYKNIMQLYPEQSLFLRSGDKVVVVDKKFNEIDRINTSDAYIAYGAIGDYELLGCGDKTVVINMQQNVVAKLDVPYDSPVRHNAVFVLRGRDCIKIDASQFLPFVPGNLELKDIFKARK